LASDRAGHAVAGGPGGPSRPSVARSGS
jgi:hypothetical protein